MGRDRVTRGRCDWMEDEEFPFVVRTTVDEKGSGVVATRSLYKKDRWINFCDVQMRELLRGRYELKDVTYTVINLVKLRK